LKSKTEESGMAVKNDKVRKARRIKPDRPASVYFWPGPGLNDRMRTNLRRLGSLTENSDGSLTLRPNRGQGDQGLELVENLIRAGALMRRKPGTPRFRPQPEETTEPVSDEPPTKLQALQPSRRRRRGRSKYAAKVNARL
jgi:hypothetical protein